MSFFGSPFSNTYNHEYEYEEDKYEDDEEKEQDEQDESDEDTEDASETDAGMKGFILIQKSYCTEY